MIYENNENYGWTDKVSILDLKDLFILHEQNIDGRLLGNLISLLSSRTNTNYESELAMVVTIFSKEIASLTPMIKLKLQRHFNDIQVRPFSSYLVHRGGFYLKYAIFKYEVTEVKASNVLQYS